MRKITPFLWFDKDAREAARFYTSVFPDSMMKGTDTFSDTPSGAVDVVTIELTGQEFVLMSAGPHFKFNEAISFVVNCESQQEVDYYWEKLTSGGGQESIGISWQVVPTVLTELLTDKDAAKAGRVMQAMLQMKKIDIAELMTAYEQQKYMGRQNVDRA